MKIILKIYNILMYCIQPIIWIRLLLISIKIPEYRKRFFERYGYLPNKTTIQSNSILIHAVSVGEVIIAKSLIYSLRKKYPSIPIIITTMTPSGSSQVLEIFKNNINNNDLKNNIYHFYLPYDVKKSIIRFINKIQIKLVIIIETELWPNFINTLHQYNIPVVIANARLSDISTKKYKLLKIFMKYILNKITLVVAKNNTDAKNFISLGLNEKKIKIIDSMKFNIFIDSQLNKKIAETKKIWKQYNKIIWIASSTHFNEENILLEAYINLIQKFPNLLLILAPRHPNRCMYVKNIVKKLKLKYILYSSKQTPFYDTNIIIVDNIGKLMLLYGISDIAFIGGSLIPKGGHNPLEAAIYKIPILTGPHFFNFNDIYIKMQKFDGLIIVKNTNDLINQIFKLLTDSEYFKKHVNKIQKIFKNNINPVNDFINLIQHLIPNQNT